MENPLDITSQVEIILSEMGEDPEREGLKDTPARYGKFLNQISKKEDFEFTSFDSEGYDQMIVQGNIPFYSMCEHHMVPFFGKAYIAYIPNKKIVGLSKLARTVIFHSRGLQNQERITNSIAKTLNDKLAPIGVGVILKARHLCMEMRGLNKPDIYTTTSALTGVFRDNEVRKEFLELIK